MDKPGAKEQFNDWPNEAGFEALHEQKSPIFVPVQGFIPSYAAGVLYRQGPRSYEVSSTPKGPFKLHHWFDGLQQTHRFELIPSDGGMSVRYNSRLASDELLRNIEKTGGWKGFSFAQKREPCTSLFGKVMSSFQAVVVDNRHRPFNDPSSENISVTFTVNMPGLPTTEDTQSKGGPRKGVERMDGPKHASGIRSLYTKTDNAYVKQLDPETLEPIGLARQDKLHPALTGPLSSAHAKTDPQTGDLYNYNLDFQTRWATYRIFCVSASTGQTSILATLSGPGISPAYLHSLFLTPDYVVLCIWSSHMAMNGLAVVWNLNLLDAIAPFSPANTTKWFVIDRHHGRGLVAEFESDPMFSFHTTNAWQEGKDVICELVSYPNTDILHKFYYDAIKSSSPEARARAEKKSPGCRSSLKRFRLSGDYIGTTTLNRTKSRESLPRAEEILVMSMGELQTINPKYSLKPHRYVYAVVDRGLSTFFDGLAKTDTATKKTIYWENETGHTPSEAIFVPNPEEKDEDDGVLLSIVLDGVKGNSYLLCLDAKNMKQLGKAEVGYAVGFGFHGAYVGGVGGSGESHCT